MNKKGFTLVELLAVIAILAILVIMALPAVLRMFTQARIDTFNNELNTIVRTTRQQYLLTGGQATTYSKESNPLNLTGNSSLNYCITINGEGQIIELKATNGSYKYESNGIVSETNSSDVEVAESGYTLSCIGSTITYVNRQNTGQITVEDEVAIGSEHFYVISSDSTNTILLTKYNLLVGNAYEKVSGVWSLTKTLSSSDPGYGLQSESAKGFYSGGTERTGVLAFSGKAYWDNYDCAWDSSSGSCVCPGTRGLKSEYANASNAAGATSYTSPYPYVYNSSMSSVAPNNEPYVSGSYTWYAAQDNGYTIAYFVEEYVNILRSLGAPSSIAGRLLTNEEASALSSTMKGNWSYWLGTGQNGGRNVFYIDDSGLHSTPFWDGSFGGVRPVIVVPTSSIPN